MAKPPYAPENLGKCPRGYDFLDDDSDPENAKEMARVLKWMQEKVEERKRDEKTSKNKLRQMIEAGAELDQLDKVSALAAVKNAGQKGFILDRLWDVLKDGYYSAKDILSSNRVKTSLTILAGIGIGAAVGVVLGTLVFPGIGSAIGGVVGAGIATGLAAVGGGVGLGILGAFAGSWFGKKVANKAFKHEKRFEISKRVTKKIKERVGISSSTAQMINGYLYNRAKAVNSPACKKFYKSLRRLAILEASPTAMEKVARFFCSELLLLEEELAKTKNKAQVQAEIEAVVYILKRLKAAEHLSKASKIKIEKTFKEYKARQEALPVAKIVQGVEYDTREELSPEILAKSTKRFLENLPEGIKPVTTYNKKSDSGAISYRYRLKNKEGETLPDVVFKSKKDKRQHLLTMVTVKANQLTESNQKEITSVIVAQAKAHHDNTGNTSVIVLAAGDDKLAVELMLAIHKAGLKPSLSEDEYPKADASAQARRRKILAKVQDKLNEASQTPRSKVLKFE